MYFWFEIRCTFGLAEVMVGCGINFFLFNIWQLETDPSYLHSQTETGVCKSDGLQGFKKVFRGDFEGFFT